MPVSYKLVPVNQLRAATAGLTSTAVIPDLAFNARYGIKSDFNCGACGEGIGIGWKQGVQPGLVAKCPHCGTFNEFVREDHP